MIPPIESDDCCLEGTASARFANPESPVEDFTDLLGTIADLRDQVRAQDQLIVGLTEELAETKADLWDAQWVPA